MSGLIIGICLVNVLFWIIFLIRFKKIFSTDSIIEKTRDQLNKMISDIDKSTERDVYLSGEAAKRIQNLLDEEEKKMEMFIQASSRLRDMIAEADRINKLSNNNSTIFQDFNKTKPVKKTYNNNINAYLKNSKSISQTKNDISESIDPESTYEPVKVQQGNLFEEEKINIMKPEINVTANGAAYKEVPVIDAETYQDQYQTPIIESSVEPRTKKHSLVKQVQELYNQGMDSDAIASHLSCSITEVDLIIAML